MVAPAFSSAPSAAPTRAAPRSPQGAASPKPSFEGTSGGRSFVSSVTTTTLVARSAAPSASRAVNSGCSVNVRPAHPDGSGTVTTETRHVKVYSRQLPQETVKTTQRSAAVETVKTTQRSVAVAAHASRNSVEASASGSSVVVRGDGCQDDCSGAPAKYKCPSCGKFQPTLEEATHHCQKWNKFKVIYHLAPSAAEEAPQQYSGVDTPTTRCSEGGSLDSSSVAPPIVVHECSATAKLGAVDSQGARSNTAVVQASELKAETFTELPSGEPISYDAVGQPIIVRQSNDETGEARTFVKNVHGAISIFGTSTITSLVSNQEAGAAGEFVDNLTDRELRGLVHELGRRVLHKSQQYQVHKEAWDSLADRANYAYFGLPEDGATEKDLEMAYRRLAKQMHPDKNGGGEEAKKRFQDMKERYEALKSRWHADDEPQGEGKTTSRSVGNSDGSPSRHEAYDEDEDIPADPEDSGSIEYDPTDRESLKKTVFQMLKHFRSLERGLEQVITQLGRQTGMQTHAKVG